MNIRAWIEAMRLRTLPVSVAGVIMACGYAGHYGCFKAVPALLCLGFAVLAQIASNFANEYYDFKAGLDRKGREGPRRGVTEGDITPEAMKRATYATLAMACATGLGLVCYGGVWLIAAGVAIALGALAYSTGPWPLSRHGLGEVAVICFFGIIPVNLTYYVMALNWSADVFIGSVAAGLMGANVLLVNNVRDVDDDRAVGKHTLATIIGRQCAQWLYLVFVLATSACMLVTLRLSVPGVCLCVAYMLAGIAEWASIRRRSGAALNPMLGMTAMTMLAACTGMALCMW
ncbi:MAG: 1,4-dihydroxy-2-naphthoate octaprenyltransferase [Muribaculaceae bacterium]|nr:1,4-dihydroxy-2-naphthoate octaprenyltransferase [Muribaculaceae bacterium]